MLKLNDLTATEEQTKLSYMADAWQNAKLSVGWLLLNWKQDSNGAPGKRVLRLKNKCVAPVGSKLYGLSECFFS